MLDFVRQYPLKYYARTVFRRTKPALGTFLAQPERLCCAFAAGDELVFKDHLEKHTGALSLSAAPKNAANFFNAAFSGPERPGEARWVVLVDTPNFAAEVISAAAKPNFQNLAQIKKLTDPRMLIEYLDPQSAKRYVFEAVGLDLQPLTEEKLPKSFLYVGLDREIQTRIEAWFNATGQHLSAIVPMQVAALAAVRNVCPRPGLQVAATPHSTTIGLFDKRGLVDCAFTMSLGEGVPHEDLVGGLQNMVLQHTEAMQTEDGAAEPTPLESFLFTAGLTASQAEMHRNRLLNEGLSISTLDADEYADPPAGVPRAKTQTFETRLLSCFLTRTKGGTQKP
ncbi:MAG: hypothetical protein JO015_01040 [Verrucomicrobia bacterium]|nr:hypothetical protein [Verrucomicrobiota bacterium]